MPRLSNVKSGAIVSVPEEKVARLGSDWVRIDGSTPAEPVAVSDTADTTTEPVIDFSDLTVAELQARLDDLNADRPDDPIVPEGSKKADLVAALEAATAGADTGIDQ